MAGFSEHIPYQRGVEAAILPHRNAGEVTLHITHKNRNALFGQSFSEALQRSSFARARRPGNQPVAISPFQEKINLPLASAAE
jgi:hypothetical protein